MTEKRILTHDEIVEACERIHDLVYGRAKTNHNLTVYPIPRGGVPVAYVLQGIAAANGNGLFITNDPEAANFFIDDIVDSGTTKERYIRMFKKPFFAVVDKILHPDPRWVVFPWEHAHEIGIEDNIVRLLQNIGEDPHREGLSETPKRVAKAWQFWSSGYGKKPEDILKTFEDGAKGVDEMVLVKDIPFYTHCEHHLAPFFGTATIAYIPDGKIVGLSKLSRLLDMFARRLQVQERLTNQIADALSEHLQPLGVGVLVKARHLCMESRGVCQQGHHTVTSALRGVIRTEAAARSEFLNLAR